MSNISDELKEILDIEQEKIINSSEKYIFVSACPGSGKTYTVVKRIEKELSEIEKYQGIVACSFTREASEELKSRINKKLEINNSFIGTIDSFVKDIVCKFVNRALINANLFSKQVIIDKKIFFPKEYVKIQDEFILKNNGKNLTINELTRYYDRNQSLKKIGNKYYSEWIKKLKECQYEVSFPTYLFATYIVKMRVFIEWFNNKYTTIYIDEAQDLNFFQHLFFKTLKDNTNVNIIMVGDANQSIYQFRGARPELFRSLTNLGYNEYKINVSIRCHPSIIYYANKIYDLHLAKNYKDESHVNLISKINSNFLNGLTGSSFILTESNNTAQELYELYKTDYDIIYTKKLDLDNKKYNDYYENSDIIDELLRYYLNYDNVIDKYKYPYEKIESILLSCNTKIKQKDFNLSRKIQLNVFLKESFLKLGVIVSDETIFEIINKLEDEKYKYNYYTVEKENRIMTIHSSKGLESDNVIIVLDNQYNNINEEFKNKLFVAITRAKNNVYILSKNNEGVSNFINNLIV